MRAGVLTSALVAGLGRDLMLARAYAGEALRLAELHEGEVDLVITDLVMPGMSGRELAERVAQIRPETPILYVSGYTDGEPVRSGLRDGKIPLLQKPFGADVLARKVRETLDSRN